MKYIKYNFIIIILNNMITNNMITNNNKKY